jgi:PhzF family phenazine biosynthesis protein
MPISIYQVDAFTSEAFKGNPAGVCLLKSPAEENWMQAVANEMNLSETAFLSPVENGFDLRWFTPAVEVSLCGHATLASAHILWTTGVLGAGQEARFNTKSGLLTATRQPDGILLNFPVKPVEKADAPANLASSLGVEPLFVGRSAFDYLVEVESEEIVRKAAPDFTLLKTLPVRGVIVTSRSSSPEFDFVSHFFAPAAGVNEDPVTGSAHCSLAQYWAEKLGKTTFNACQASARGGFLNVILDGDRVLLRGQAVTVLHGELEV